MDSDLLNDLYSFIPEKFFLRNKNPSFDVYRTIARDTSLYREGWSCVTYITNRPIFDFPSMIIVEKYLRMEGYGLVGDHRVTISSVHGGKIDTEYSDEPKYYTWVTGDKGEILSSIQVPF